MKDLDSFALLKFSDGLVAERAAELLNRHEWHAAGRRLVARIANQREEKADRDTAGRHERAVAAAQERADMAVERARLANAKARVAVRAASEVQSKEQLAVAKLTSMPRPPATPPP